MAFRNRLLRLYMDNLLQINVQHHFISWSRMHLKHFRAPLPRKAQAACSLLNLPAAYVAAERTHNPSIYRSIIAHSLLPVLTRYLI
jgi:hypothetical protein